MRKLLYLFMFAVGISTFGQESDLIPNQVNYPSVEAFKFANFGNVNINESSGLLDEQISLYTYEAGRLKTDISLRYIGNGVKVDELSGNVGVNWLNRTGGVITRTIQDLPDEFSPSNRHLYDSEYYQNLDLTNSQNLQNLIDLESSSVVDTQSDVFNFTFGNYSGTFYLDQNLNPIIGNNRDELKIEFINGFQYTNNNQTILITDPNGVKYYFGGNNGCEKTRFGEGITNALIGITSFYLYKIENIFGDIIYFDYLSTESTQTVLSIFESAHHFELFSHLSIMNFPCNSPPNITDARYKKNTVLNNFSPRYINKIRNNRTNQEILFNYQNVAGNQHYKKILQSIKITNFFDSNTFEKINFEHEIYSTRFFLKKIKFYVGENIFEKSYEFEYNEPSLLPDRLSYSQDFLGYYNGKYNSTLLPKNKSSYFNISDLADRSPDFENSKLGSLKKIIYPTGGYSEIFYESKPILKKVNEIHTMHVYQNKSMFIPNTKLIDVISLAQDLPEDANIHTQVFEYPSQTLTFNINVEASGNLSHTQKIYVSLINLTDNVTETKSMHLYYQVYSYNQSFSFNFEENKAYRIKIELDTGSGQGTFEIDVQGVFYLQKGLEIVNNGDLGLRIKKVISKPLIGDSIIKKYFYHDIPKEIDWLDYSYNFMGQDVRQDNNTPGCFNQFRDYYLQTDPLGSLKDYFNSSENYKEVSISYGGDNFENGGIYKKFRNLRNDALIILPKTLENENGLNIHLNFNSYSNFFNNKNAFNGLLLEEKYLINKNGEIMIDKHIKYNYTVQDDNFITNTYLKRFIDITNEDYSTSKTFFYGTYKYFNYKLKYNSKEEINYINPLPYNSNNFNDLPKIVNTFSYEYQDYIGLPTKITYMNSALDDEVITKNNYFSPSSYNYILLHNISQPYLTEVFRNNEKIVSTKFNYYSGGVKLLSKATNKDLFINNVDFSILEYDNYNNPLEIANRNGITECVIWGYNQTQPVAKIEGIAYSAIPQDLINNIQYLTNSASTTETQVLAALNALRNAPSLANAMVTTFTYKPLIGVSTVTDPKGDTQYYIYDEFHKLQYVKDKDGNVLSENQYHYRE